MSVHIEYTLECVDKMLSPIEEDELTEYILGLFPGASISDISIYEEEEEGE